MSKSNAMENGLLELFFKGTTFANIADNAGTSPLANLYIALHTADPTEAGNQTSNECAYTSYARVAVPRSGSGWNVSGNAASNAAAITFPTATGGSETATHFSIGSLSSGAGVIYYIGALSSPLAISTGITPEFAIGDLDVTEE